MTARLVFLASIIECVSFFPLLLLTKFHDDTQGLAINKTSKPVREPTLDYEVGLPLTLRIK